MHVKRSHGFAAIVTAGLALLVQVFVTHGFAPSSLLLAHFKQLVALVPKIISDLGCIVLVGPSSSAMPRRDVYLFAFISCFLPHTYRVFSAAARHAADQSPDTLVVVIQSASTLAIDMAAFIFHLVTGYSVWGCLRLTHTLVGAYGIALCIFYRFYTDRGSAAKFPPLRGSYEGGLLVFMSFIGISWWLTPTRRLRLHVHLADMFPEGWLPLSELKRDELKALLKDETHPCWASDALPALMHRELDARLALEPCGASTLGSNSELGELGAMAVVPAPELEVEELPLSRAYYERRHALHRTLQVCGLVFSDGDTDTSSARCSQSSPT